MSVAKKAKRQKAYNQHQTAKAQRMSKRVRSIQNLQLEMNLAQEQLKQNPNLKEN